MKPDIDTNRITDELPAYSLGNKQPATSPDFNPGASDGRPGASPAPDKTKLKPTRIITNGLICDLVRARKFHSCTCCNAGIVPSEWYWRINATGAGLNDLKHPDKVCVLCFPGYIKKEDRYG